MAIAFVALAGCATGNKFDAKPPLPVWRSWTTVRILTGQGPVERVVKLSRSHEDGVCWHNEDAQDQAVSFTDWPFREPQQVIQVPAGRSSRTFHVSRTIDTGTYTYAMTPGVPRVAQQARGEGAPDPPAVEVGD